MESKNGKLESIEGIKKKQIITWVLGGVGLLLLLFLAMKLQEKPAISEDEAALKIKDRFKAITSGDSDKDKWIEKSEEKFKILEETVKEQSETLKRLTSLIEREKGNNKRINKNKSSYPPPIVPLLSNKITSSTNKIPAQPKGGPPFSSKMNSSMENKNSYQPASNLNKKKNALRVINGSPKIKKEDEKKEEKVQKKKWKTNKTYLKASTFIPTILLSGLDAPTGGQAQRNPHPVLLLIKDLSTMPLLIQKQAKECRILASGYGSLSSERAFIRGETITCELRNGKIIEKPIKGYLAGEDGKNGVRGRVVEKAGKYLAYSLAAGFAEGVGDGFSTATSTVSVSPLGVTSSTNSSQLLESGAYSGASSAMERLADYYIKKADQIFAIIEVDASRQVEFIVLEGVELT